MKEKKICTSCGLATFSSDAECPNCGEKFVFDSVTNKIEKPKDDIISENTTCRNCGFENESNFNYCGKCGTPLKENISSKKKTSQMKTQQEIKAGTQDKLSSNLIYFILGLFVLIIIVIFIIKKQDSAVPESSSQSQKPANIPTQDVPQIDVQQLNALKSRLQSNANDKEALLEIANLYHDGQSLNLAIDYYKKFLALDETNPDARVDMAICYFENQDNENAIKEMKKAITYSPKHQKAHYNIGIVSMRMGDIKQSKEYFKKAYEIDSTTDVGQQSKMMIEQHIQVMK